VEYVTHIRDLQRMLGAFLSVIPSTNSSIQNINLKCPKIHTKKLNIKKLTSFGLSVTILSEYKIMHKNCIYFLLKIRLFSVIPLSEQSSELNYNSTLSITLKSMND
jgi:hypothetical protein